MDQMLLNAMTEEVDKGNRYDSVWTSEACTNMYQIEQIYVFVKDKPHATRWRKMQIKNYDILEELYGADRATRKHAKTSKQRTKQWEKETIDLNDCSENVEIHHPNVSMNDEQQFSPPNLDAFSPQYAHSNHSTDTSTSRGTKRKRNMVEIMEAQYERMHV
ncbi:hypothetical protein TanjilG_06985 [Lupinus angustifolius]|uniref:Myb/SANT-like domain-containing protein n=1 Tax=Lupinus angustifolius TaxID=3871 RepID=A0A1J7I2S6_LUPAN|nr:hypothetical protein TanjilG_06985 [Lupinus angustifolius]